MAELRDGIVTTYCGCTECRAEGERAAPGFIEWPPHLHPPDGRAYFGAFDPVVLKLAAQAANDRATGGSIEVKPWVVLYLLERAFPEQGDA